MANVITYGTFDLFHVGYLRLLQRARSAVRKELLCHGGCPHSIRKGHLCHWAGPLVSELDANLVLAY